MRKVILLISLIIINFSLIVKADTCSSSEMKRLKELAEKIEFSYDYKVNKHTNNNEVWDTIDFSITATNLNNEIKTLVIYNFYNGDYLEFKNNGSNMGTLQGFSEGERVSITMKAYTNNGCSSKDILTKTIKLPYYNQYYDEKFCKENEKFKYCNILTASKLTSNEYYNALNEYRKETEFADASENINENNNSNIIKIIIIASVSLIIVITITVIILKKKRKNAL